MTPYSARAALVTTVLLAAVLSVACTSPAPAAPSPAQSVPAQSVPAPAADGPVTGPTPADGSGGHGRGDRGRTAAAVPVGWPADVPLPPGAVQGSTGDAGQWAVLLLEPGAAADVQRSTVAFYVAAGFVADQAQILRRAPYAVTVAAENRDHSATETNLTIGLVRH